MAQEETLCRQVDASLERQRLTGALDESRRALRNSLTLGLVGPAAAAASADKAAKTARLEAQVSELGRKCEDLTAELERERRRGAGLEAAQLEAALGAQREAEARRLAAERETEAVREEAELETTKLRGALEQLRSMLKAQGGVPPPLGLTSAGGYPGPERMGS